MFQIIFLHMYNINVSQYKPGLYTRNYISMGSMGASKRLKTPV